MLERSDLYTQQIKRNTVLDFLLSYTADKSYNLALEFQFCRCFSDTKKFHWLS